MPNGVASSPDFPQLFVAYSTVTKVGKPVLMFQVHSRHPSALSSHAGNKAMVGFHVTRLQFLISESEHSLFYLAVTLLSAEAEIQFVALRNINLIVQKR